MKSIRFIAILIISIFSLLPLSVSAQTTPTADNLFPNANLRWVDSVFNTLSVDEKIGQLMMPRGNYSYEYDTARFNKIVEIITWADSCFFATVQLLRL